MSHGIESFSAIISLTVSCVVLVGVFVEIGVGVRESI
jgi:hypothetical protein